MIHRHPIARLGTAMTRFVFRVLLHLLYRLRADGLRHIPRDGAALLVANHVTFIDSLLIAALSPRATRFVMHKKYYEIWGLGWFFRMVGAIPIAGYREDPAMLDRAMDLIDDALAHDELVVIFPEGALTRDGEMIPFRPGVERILDRRPVPVVPMALRGLWGSRFSRAPKQAKGSGPRRVFELAVGPKLAPAIADCPTLFDCVADLRGEMR
jgi:1-acyl-sn-glycerol-3-phosphate acyltransferase